MRRVDEGSIIFGANWYLDTLLDSDENFAIESSSTETYGYDFRVYSLVSGNDIARVEVKTKNMSFEEWSISTTGRSIYFGLVPPIEKDIKKVSKFWTKSKPTQAQIQAQKDAEHESGRRVRWFCLNAASGPDFHFDECPNCPKWYKMFEDEKSELLIIFNDGVLRFDHQQLFDAFVGYGYLYTLGSEEYYRNSGKYWQFKAFFDIDKGTFSPCDVPKDILPKRKFHD